ncbi:MAG: roadblock/LC7 domain-containing protein [Gemmatimonadales bacterium]|jgi:predicted regulator of Ras-like GTPase activity (Roadblock/LC7/MglB family)
MRGSAFKDTLDSVMKMPGIRGALVVAVHDGLVVDGRVHVGVHGAAVAALAASLYRRACQATGDGDDIGRFVELDADQGRIMIAGTGDLALMAVVEKRANAGQARLAVRRAAAHLEE